MLSFDRFRIWLAGRILTPGLWRRMCAAGFCPAEIHRRAGGTVSEGAGRDGAGRDGE